MKECYKCGHLAEDDDSACPVCGCKALIETIKNKTVQSKRFINKPIVNDPVSGKTTRTFRDAINDKNSAVRSGVLILICAIGIIVVETNAPNKAVTAHPKTCVTASFSCISKQNEGDAYSPCRRAIEQLARHNYRWTDGLLEGMFTRSWWVDKDRVIAYSGRAVELQNGLGAYLPARYVCEFDIITKKVISARVTP